MTVVPDSPSRRTVARRRADERADSDRRRGITRYRWEDYEEQCKVNSEPIDLDTVSKFDLKKANDRRAAWRKSQELRIRMANMLRRTYVETLGQAPTVIVGGDDDL